MREVIHFGVRVSATSIVTQIGVQASTLVLGRVLGVAAVGLYGRAHTLIFLFQQQIVGAIGRVAFPALAEARRAGSAPGPHLLRGVVYVTGVAWPLYGFIICVAAPLFEVLFGPQWSASVSVAQVLAIGAAIPAMIPFFGVTLLSLGRVNDLLIGEIILVVARVAVLVVVAPYGLMAVAVSQVVMHAVSFAVWTTFIRRATGLSRRQLLRAASKSVPLAAAGSAGASLLLLATGHVPAWLHVAGSAIFAAGGWLLATWLTKHPLWGEIVRLFLWVKPRVLAYSRSARG
jgi:O-antigen/teichoic acid export membrane protein